MKRLCTLVPLLAGLVCPPIFAQVIVFDTGFEPETHCFGTGSCTQGTVNSSSSALGGCSNLIYSYKIDLNNNGFVDILGDGNTVNMAMSVGTHRIIWKATDNCAHISTASRLVTVKDCTSPNLLCINGLTQSLTPVTCDLSFTASFFIQNVTDNCTPQNQLQLGVRKSGDGTGFPTATTVTFDKCDLGTNTLEVWAKDANGLSNKCFVYVLVQAGNSGCICNPDGDVLLKGCARTAGGKHPGSFTMSTKLESTGGVATPVKKVRNQIEPDSCWQSAFGSLPFGGNYKVSASASRSGDPLNGVSTFDQLLISKHILGVDTFTTVYKMLAADVNGSGSVTTFDILEIRKLILGIYDTFPSAPSWRFVRPVANPGNLGGAAQVKSSYDLNLTNLQNDTTLAPLDFICLKMGDVNFSAIANNAWESDDRAGLLLTLPDREILAGQVLEIPVQFTENQRVEGLQLALGFDPTAVEMEDVSAAGLPGFGFENFTVLPSGELRLSWFDPAGAVFLEKSGQVFSLKIKALRCGRLADLVWLAEKSLRPEAYLTGTIRPTKLALSFSEKQNLGAAGVQFFAPQPNPFREETVLGVLAKNSTSGSLEVVDLTGRTVLRCEMPVEKGFQTWRVSAAELPNSGVYFLRATAAGQVFAQKIVLLGN